MGVVRMPLTSTMTAATLADERDAASRSVTYVLGIDRPWKSADNWLNRWDHSG